MKSVLLPLACLLAAQIPLPGFTESTIYPSDINSTWKCKYCPTEDDLTHSGTIEIGSGSISNDSFSFGNYTGLYTEGPYLIGGLQYQFRGNNAKYFDFTATQLGLESRQAEIDTGRQGVFTLQFEYDQLPKLTTDTAKSPYLGDDTLTLPGNWVPGSTTADFATLNANLLSRDIRTDRNTAQAKANGKLARYWTYHFSVKRVTKNGHKVTGAALGSTFVNARSVLLRAPIHYTTDDFSIALRHASKQYVAEIKYAVSAFRNEHDSLRWRNAFSEPTAVNQGQLALAPNNVMNQLSVSGASSPSRNLRMAGYISAASTQQNQIFLPYTINNTIDNNTLPVESLKGRADTFNGNIHLSYRHSKTLRTDLRYTQEQYDNETSRYFYRHVILDTEQSRITRANLPFSYRKQKTKLKTDFKLGHRSRIFVGYNYQLTEHIYQEVPKSGEGTFWLKLNSRIGSTTDFTVKLEKRRRNGAAYNTLIELDKAENPLLRKYYLADRERNFASVNLALNPSQYLALNLSADQGIDEYTESTIGLTASKEINYSLAADYILIKTLNIHGFYNITRLNSKQAGSEAFSTADWFVDNDESVFTAGIDLRYSIEEKKIDFGLTLTHSESYGKIRFTQPDSALPALTLNRDAASLYATQKFSDDLAVTVRYLLERLQETTDWSIDSVSNDTIADVLSLGELSPSYDITVFNISVKYFF